MFIAIFQQDPGSLAQIINDHSILKEERTWCILFVQKQAVVSRLQGEG